MISQLAADFDRKRVVWYRSSCLMDLENTGSVSVLTDAINLSLFPVAGYHGPSQQADSGSAKRMLSGIAKQKTSTESRRVEKGRKRSKTLLGFAAERGVM